MNTAIALSTFATLSAPVKNALQILSAMLHNEEISIEVYRRWVRFIIRTWIGTVPLRIIGRPLSLVRKTVSLSLSCAGTVLSLGTNKNCGLKTILSTMQTSCAICEFAMLPAEVLLALVALPLSYVSSTKAASIVHNLTSFNASMDYLDYRMTMETRWNLDEYHDDFATPFRDLVLSSDRPTSSSYRTFLKNVSDDFFEKPDRIRIDEEQFRSIVHVLARNAYAPFESTNMQK